MRTTGGRSSISPVHRVTHRMPREPWISKNSSARCWYAAPMTSFGIGGSVKRREDYRLLTGRGRYADDVNAPGQTYAAFVRSPHAHAAAVAVRYAARPPVVDAVAALADGAPPLHAGVAGNRCYDWECGDAAATARAIATAAHVTRLTLLDNRLVTCFMEPRAALAEWDAAAGRYTLHASLQSVHALALNLARVLRVPV